VRRPPEKIDLLLAVWVVNRAAKRYRDSASAHYQAGQHGFARYASETKGTLYHLKSQALAHLEKEGHLRVVAHHAFPEGNWAEVLESGKYRFHRPCPTPSSLKPSDNPFLEEITKKPRESKEPRLCDAQYTLKAYLADKTTAEVYQWSRPTKEAFYDTWEDDPEEEAKTWHDWYAVNDVVYCRGCGRSRRLILGKWVLEDEGTEL
jgi:hypothetical protein